MASTNPPPTTLPPVPAPAPTKLSSKFKQKILDLHNRKRSLAGVGKLSWDIKKQHEAKKWLPSVCVHPIPLCSELMQNFWRPFSNPGKTEAEYAELYFNAIYEEVNPHFLFAGENTMDVAGCYSQPGWTLKSAVFFMRNIYFFGTSTK